MPSQSATKNTLRTRQRARLYLLQIMGIALITVGFMNSVFLPQSSFLLNGFWFIIGASLLGLSMRLWRYYRRPRIAMRRSARIDSSFGFYPSSQSGISI